MYINIYANRTNKGKYCILNSPCAYLLTSGNCQGGDFPPTNSSKGEILCVAFKHTKLYLVVAYM